MKVNSYPNSSQLQGQEEVCAVCGGGVSEAPNQIVFCERCDVAVHQQCYGLGELPSEEWLCEPCRCHEHELTLQGMPKAQVRPPRWQRTDPTGHMEGGSHSVGCELCPVRRGAFAHVVKDASEAHVVGRLWVHLVCAHRAPECEVDLTRGVLGVRKAKARAGAAECVVCGLSDGCTCLCSAPGCTRSFHPLCGRNAGFLMPIKDGKRGQLKQYW